jgi:mRNA interferase YafQ
VKIHQEKRFRKDLNKIMKQGKDFNKLTDAIEILISPKTLEPKYKEHPLHGNYKGYRECHLEPDWLLIYKLQPEVLMLARTGSHSDLF